MNRNKLKKLSSLLAAASIVLSAVAEATLPGEVDLRVEQLLKALHPATQPSPYGVNEYRQDLKEIADQARSVNQASLFARATAQERAIVTLALAVQDSLTADRVEELATWYGQYVHELPDQYLQERVENSNAAARALGREAKSLEELREQLKNGPENYAKIIPYRPPVSELREEHTKPDCLNAWAFWLMAPPSAERGFMAGKINKALEAIGDDSVIPLIVEALKFDTAPAERDDTKKGTAFAYINLICGMPGEKALDALLEINRYAIENGLNGDDYFKSVTRHIVRRLASRRAYADQLIDPKMKEIIDRQGHNEKPEDIPLTDELWKVYKPLVAARLKAKNSETPQADIELLEAAQQIMPNK